MNEEIQDLIDDEHLIEEAKSFLIRAAEFEADNRANGLEDVRFSALGEQWPSEIQTTRTTEKRPVLTINKTDVYCRQVENQQRQQRPRMIVHGTTTAATKKIADVVQGLLRHIELQSNAEYAYDNAFRWALRMGWGYFRIRADYCREDSFDQDLYIEPIDNPLTVYIDPNSVLLDGSDMNCCLITSLIDKEVFKSEYPNADFGGSFDQRSSGDGEWITEDQIRVAEYYERVRVSSKLYRLSDGSSVFEDVLPSEETLKSWGLSIVNVRDSYKFKIMWYKLTGMEVLEKRELPGRYIPIIPVYGNVVNVEGKRKKFGLVRFLKDPQRMVNYWETAATETIALAPKAKWLAAEGQTEGHENEWANANLSAKPLLTWTPATDANGQTLPPPQRLQPEPPPVGILQALATATENMREVAGMADPAQRIDGNVSGKALISERQQSDNSTFHFYDNLTMSIRHCGKIILDLIPYYYDTEREMRIVGDDGKPNVIVINQRQTTAEGEVIKNNVSVGQYDIVMDTGPGYNSKRQEAVAAMTPLMGDPKLMEAVGDLYFRNSDFPGAEIIADRLASVNPLAQVDEQSDIPVQAQLAIKNLQQQLQQAQQQMQQMGLVMKSRQDVEAMRQAGETQREHMRSTVKAHDTETWASENIRQTQLEVDERRYDAELKSETQKAIAQYQGMITMMLNKMGSPRKVETAKRTHARFPGYKIREVINA